MPGSKSELFNDFFKQLEEGKIRVEAYNNLKDYEDDPKARAGTEDLENLYNLKHPDVKYDRNIAEEAHPEPCIINPSYDKLNGLVENVNERNDIMSNLALNISPGTLAHTKYAHKELVMELVRIANEMDAANKEELFKLADQCLMQLSK